MKPIFILHENEEWLVPLRAEFAQRGVEVQEWFLNEDYVAFEKNPQPGVYYNRMSASSHTRGHRFAPELTRMALTWLEHAGDSQVQVVNGTRALYLETCKLSQYAALQKAGIRTPKTRAVVGRSVIAKAAEDFAQWPVILKPNRGGKGLGVIKFDDLSALQQFVEGPDYHEPLDGIWLLQAYIQSAAPFITRCEFVGQRFVYAVQVDTTGGFELCPADICAIDDAACPVGESAAAPAKFVISERYHGHSIIGQLETFMRNSGVDIAGIELIEDKYGDVYAYDVNTNTNYNQAAEAAAGGRVTGMGAVADYLIALAR
ncbi:alpha-L-glutamate ligase [Aliidiomarina sedimenti]|uniref:Alpha-L-glutamate ligase n=1 Tax=Aliidiomarina sedimenti TaxID=1933879 RepID=A0ABY0BY98_9GAMM|nr:alpha-L-glutamate ligase [Aliidiomarina sedimenti]RUO29318.1 alpha-L-glutamate ligase [Aliidiomarina sedimenti]